MQFVNGVAAVLAIGQMIADPSTSWRFGLDLVTHGLSIYAFDNKDNIWGRIAAHGVNCARLGAIYADGQFGLVEAADTVLHVVNAAGVLLSASDEREEATPSPSHR